MTKEEMIDLLNEALRHERRHLMFYQHAQYITKTTLRLFINPFWEKEMMGEIAHMKLFADKIVALGGVPTLEYTELHPEVMTNPVNMLQYAAHMEQEVLDYYHSIYPKAEEYATTFNDMSIVLLLEENIEDTTVDLEEIRKLISLT